MARIRMLNITTATDATTTGMSIILGGRVTNAERGAVRTTFVLTGDVGSANGDTVQIQVGADSASGVFVLEKLDPLSVLDHIDSSGEFTSPGAVNIDSAPGLFCRAIFKAASPNGTSSLSLWAVGAVCTADSSARGTLVHGGP